MLLFGLLAARVAWADPPRRTDSGVRAPSTSKPAVALTLGQTPAFDADPFQLTIQPVSVWYSPALAGRGVSAPIFSPLLAPQVTLKLATIAGLQPLFILQPRLPLGGSPGIGSELALRYGIGPWQTGTSLSFSRDARGLLLNSLSFVRYVAPSYHLGLQDRALWSMSASARSWHTLTASTGIKPAPSGPALRFSSTPGQTPQQTRWAAALSGLF